ncbi:MAG: hypothetical protein U1F43_37185 [Myxococcota bacterium]
MRQFIARPELAEIAFPPLAPETADSLERRLRSAMLRQQAEHQLDLLRADALAVAALES